MTSSQRISEIKSEFDTVKTNYSEQKIKYDELIKEIELQKDEIDKTKSDKESELNEVLKELNLEKEKIQDILGSANMASMAKSFLDRKKELDTPIKDSSNWRNGGLVGMAVMIILLILHEWYIKGDGFNYISMLSRLPLISPLIWLVWVNSQRNAHLVRIQEEYAHKASIAMAFEGYQRKVDETNDLDIKKLLLELSVSNLGENPVNLFDKKVKASPIEDSILARILDKLLPKQEK